MDNITLNSVTFDFSVDGNSEEAFAFTKSVSFDLYVPQRYSVLLALQIQLLAKKRILSSYRILDVIRSLEGVGYSSKLKAESEFKGKFLKGLWHKHYLPNSIGAFSRNLINSIKMDDLPSLKQLELEAESTKEERYLTEHDLNLIIDDAVIGAWERRCSKASVTGEWIVFAKYQGQNYYLCLAKHSDGDAKIRSLIEAVCVHEFPFLKDILNPI